MNRKLIEQYRKKFTAVRKIEEIENKKLSLDQKMQQLSALFSFFKGIIFNFNKEDKTLYTKSNWALLKR